MQLPRQEDIACLFMAELAGAYGKGHVSVATIARRHGLSAVFLKKITRKLKAAGLVKSKEGTGGGYILSMPPGRISIWSVLAAFEGEQHQLVGLSGGRKTCPIYPDCLPQKVRSLVRDTVKVGLTGITLQDVAAPYVS